MKRSPNESSSEPPMPMDNKPSPNVATVASKARIIMMFISTLVSPASMWKMIMPWLYKREQIL